MTATRATADLGGRVAIVTGAGARGDGIGNGRAAAILLAEAGAHVLAVDRKPELAEATVEMISRRGRQRRRRRCRCDRRSRLRGNGEQAALDQWGQLDILVNNVGIGSSGTVVTEDVDRWERVMDVNLTSMVLASRTPSRR